MAIVRNFTAITSDDVWTDGFGQLRQVLTFGFAEEVYDWQQDVENAAFRASFRPLSDRAENVARDAFDAWASVSALRFIETDPQDADIVLGVYNFDRSPARAPFAGFAFFPAGGELKIGGDVFLDAGSATDPSVMLHEIGHALGLEHPFEGPRTLPAALDLRENTVMSNSGPATDRLERFDIEAIRSMYGPPADTPPAILPAVGYADLFTIQFSTTDPLQVGAADNFTIIVENLGEDPTFRPTTVVAALSVDDVLDAGDVKIGEALIRTLAPGEDTGRLDLVVTPPGCVAPGVYNVILAVDPDNLVPETRELNNFDVLPGFQVLPAAAGVVVDPADCPSPFAPDDEAPLDGQPGDDLLTGDAAPDLLGGGAGRDTLIGRGGPDTLDGGGGADRLVGNGGGDLLLGRGGRDEIVGNGGRDALEGGGGRDVLQGGGGRDSLDGGGGRDVLDGGGGRDTLDGGRGADMLTGGGGGDVFFFARGAGGDRLTDFQQGRDRIEIGEGADGFDDLRILDRGEDVLIRFANVGILVEDAEPGQFTAADFLFGS